MNNSFDLIETLRNIETRSQNIETLLLDIKQTKAPEVQNEEELLTVQETAAFLKLSVPTIYLKVSQRELSSMKRSKRLYFSKKELIEYLKAGKRKSSQEISDEADNHLGKMKGGSRE
jgi:excisionase family DNA binding protein